VCSYKGHAGIRASTSSFFKKSHLKFFSISTGEELSLLMKRAKILLLDIFDFEGHNP